MEKKLEFYRELLINESKRHGIYSPLTAAPKNGFDEIFNNCFLGDGNIAKNTDQLKELGITHILNASKGEKFSQVDTNQTFYKNSNLDIKFKGINAMDVFNFKLEKYFDECSDFITECIDKNNGKLLVHCYMGMSRSAALLIAYLIKERQLNLEDSIKLISKKRFIWPNDGFINQLIEWEKIFFKQ